MEDLREPGCEQLLDGVSGLVERMICLRVQHEALWLDCTGVDVLAGGVVEHAVAHAVYEQERLAEALDRAGAVQLGR